MYGIGFLGASAILLFGGISAAVFARNDQGLCLGRYYGAALIVCDVYPAILH